MTIEQKADALREVLAAYEDPVRLEASSKADLKEAIGQLLVICHGCITLAEMQHIANSRLEEAMATLRDAEQKAGFAAARPQGRA